jgi:hypothetical protein
MRNALLFLGRAFVFLAVPSLLGQSFPKVDTAKVQAAVVASEGTFKYGYTITNGPTSGGTIWLVNIDISQPKGGLLLSGVGLSNGQGFLANSSIAMSMRKQAVATVPVGIASPSNWFGGVSVSGTVQWGAGNDLAVVFPQQSVSGFQLSSPGLPAIRSFTARPHLDVDALPIAPLAGPDDLARYITDLEAFEKQVTTQGVTIAPTAPPAEFQPAQFLKTILGYKEQALIQGWITNRGIANSLDVKLNAALDALQAEDSKTAKNILNALLNEVKAQTDKHLTPDAIALLQFNTEYLISKIP